MSRDAPIRRTPRLVLIADANLSGMISKEIVPGCKPVRDERLGAGGLF